MHMKKGGTLDIELWSAASGGKAPTVFHACCNNNYLSREKGWVKAWQCPNPPEQHIWLSWEHCYQLSLHSWGWLSLPMGCRMAQEEKLAADSGASQSPSPELCSLSRDTAATTTLPCPQPCPVQSLQPTRSCRVVLEPPPTTWTTAQCFVIAHAATDLSNPFTSHSQMPGELQSCYSSQKDLVSQQLPSTASVPSCGEEGTSSRVHAMGCFLFVCVCVWGKPRQRG